MKSQIISSRKVVEVWRQVHCVLLDPVLSNVLDFDLQQEVAELVWYYFSTSRSSSDSIEVVLTFLENSLPYLVTHVTGLLYHDNLELSDEAFRNCARFWSLTQNNDTTPVNRFRYLLVNSMAKFLDSSSPLHRFSAKNWLYSIKNLTIIFSPLFRQLVDKVNFEYTPETSYP